MGKSVSFCKGKGSLTHNNREFITSNVDKERTHLNVIYKQEPIKVAYEKLFGEELERYNANQKRADRKIHDYMEHIKKSKNGEKLFYENVVQVGTMYTCSATSEDGKIAKEILHEYMQGFQKRNPNLYVFNAVLHMDEATPHLHIDWIPIATGYQNGLQVRNSLDKALKQQSVEGISNKKGNRTQAWQKAERGCLIEVMERHGWEYEKAAIETDRESLTPNQYKAMVEELNNRIEAIPDEVKINRKKSPLLGKDKVIVSASELDTLEQRVNMVDIRDTSLSNIKNEMQEKLDEVRELRKSVKQEELQAFNLKQDMARKSVELDEVKKDYEKLYREQLGLNKENARLKNMVLELDDVIKEQKTVISSLKAENEKIRKVFTESIQNAVLRAVEPFKQQIEGLKEKLERMALGQSTLLKAVKYVTEHFAGTLSNSVLQGVSKVGDEWLREDGFAELADPIPSIPPSIAKEMNLNLDYMDGDEGRGVYSKSGTCVMNVSSLKEAREYFPNCSIENKTRTMSWDIEH